MALKIMAFGRLAEIFERAEWEEPLPMSCLELKNSLTRRYPMLENVKFAVAVNKKTAEDATLIPDGATVALLPPFSGG